jgi:flagellar hook protein FlgE
MRSPPAPTEVRRRPDDVGRPEVRVNQGRVVLSAILLASACVDITVNNQSASADAGAACSLGGTGGTPETSPAGSGGNAIQPPKATDSIIMRGNLDQTSEPKAWDPVTPKTTSNFTTTVTVWDSLGKAIQLDIYFVKHQAVQTQPGDSGDWTYHVMTDGANLDFQSDGATPTTPGRAIEILTGTLRFDTSGRLISNIITSQGFYPAAAMIPQPLAFDFGTGTDTGGSGSGLDGLTQYAAVSSVSFVVQSGTSARQLP